MKPTSSGVQRADGDDDAELRDRIRDGDAGGLSAMLYDRHANAVFGFAFRRTASWATAEDVLQTTFLKAWRTLSDGDPGFVAGIHLAGMAARPRR